jgi:hypothetical protein
MTEVFHHDAELTDFLRISTSREVFSGVCMGKGNYMKSHLEPPEVLKYGKTNQNHPQNVKKNDCGERLFRGGPNKAHAGDDGKNVEPPELLVEQKTRKDNSNLGGKTPCFYSVDFCPVVFG